MIKNGVKSKLLKRRAARRSRRYAAWLPHRNLLRSRPRSGRHSSRPCGAIPTQPEGAPATPGEGHGESSVGLADLPPDNPESEWWLRFPKGHEQRSPKLRHAGVQIAQEGPTLVLGLDATGRKTARSLPGCCPRTLQRSDGEAAGGLLTPQGHSQGTLPEVKIFVSGRAQAAASRRASIFSAR